MVSQRAEPAVAGALGGIMDQGDGSRRARAKQAKPEDAASLAPSADVPPNRRKAVNRRLKASVVGGKPKDRNRVGKLTWMSIEGLVPDPRNPRNHSRAQVRALARSIEAFGFNAPILIDNERNII